MRLGKTTVPTMAMDIAKGTGAAALLSVAAVLLFALGLKALPIGDAAIPVINQILKVGSVTAGSMLAVGRGGEKGLIKGVVVGLLYMALGLLVYWLMDRTGVSVPVIVGDLGLGALSGAVSGVLAANLTPPKPKK